MKTKVEEFLIQKEYCPTKPWFDSENNYYSVRPCIIQEYADQQTKELREEIERLKSDLDKIRTENIAFRIKIIDKGARS